MNNHGPEVSRLLSRLFNDPNNQPVIRLIDLKIFPGDNPGAPEDIAREMNSAFDQEANGTAKVSTTFEDKTPTRTIEEFLAEIEAVKAKRAAEDERHNTRKSMLLENMQERTAKEAETILAETQQRRDRMAAELIAHPVFQEHLRQYDPRPLLVAADRAADPQ